MTTTKMTESIAHFSFQEMIKQYFSFLMKMLRGQSSINLAILFLKQTHRIGKLHQAFISISDL